MRGTISPAKILRRLLRTMCWVSASMLMAQEVGFDQRHLWEAQERVRISPDYPEQVGHRELGAILRALARRSPETLHIEEVGTSVEGRALYLVRAGRGSQRVLLWSQMHGDEPTATSALLDILSYLTQGRKEACASRILEGVTLLVMPMLNPDGAARRQRRNALGIDINRDARDLQTPEARALKAVHQQYRPQFAFNLHDQGGRRTVGRSGRLAAVALLAPPFDWEESDNAVRIRAKKVASVLAQSLAPFVYGHVSRYDAGFMPRAFGDAMQAWGTSTLLLETGGWYRDDPQFMVRLNFVALLTALYAIATGTVEQAHCALYDTLPENGDPLYDLLIMDGSVWDGTHEMTFLADIGINFDHSGKGGSDSLGMIAEVGDLDGFAAKDTIDARGHSWCPA
ncbi:MAG: M14 family zinc carboxypeptidase [Candidatus Oleimicrobiaceae bacterium]